MSSHINAIHVTAHVASIFTICWLSVINVDSSKKMKDANYNLALSNAKYLKLEYDFAKHKDNSDILLAESNKLLGKLESSITHSNSSIETLTQRVKSLDDYSLKMSIELTDKNRRLEKALKDLLNYEKDLNTALLENQELKLKIRNLEIK